MTFKETKILKNFNYPVACLDMCLSESGKYLGSIGTYKPSVKIHDLTNISQKSNRHLEAEPIKIVSLSKNIEKLALLRVDRYVELHVKYGMHERIRMPKLCYDMKYNKFNCQLLASGKSNELYRFDLIEGKFCDSYITTLDFVTSLDINLVHGLVGYCGDKKIEFIDQRNCEVVSTTNIDESLSQMSFSSNGINFCTGSDQGDVKIYDLRSKKEFYTYKHESEIRKVKMIEKSVVSADKNELVIFSDGKIFDKIRTDCPINTFETDGGVIFLGLDESAMRTYFSTEFGNIPDWCNVIKVDDNI
ncbi:hypothetical protein P3W45_001094 [Vairimorpha bombi]|jgi:ribosome biogenesis protein ENP2